MKESMNENLLLPSTEIRSCLLKDDGKIPNHPRWPLVLYLGAMKPEEEDAAGIVEQLLTDNGWVDTWRNGIYSYHHFHSTAHEVLVVYSGSAKVQLGGEQGITETVKAGDVIILPAGVGHKNLGSSSNFRVIGAYPKEQEPDLCTGKPGERPGVLENIQKVALPEADPIYGPNGHLLTLWQ